MPQARRSIMTKNEQVLSPPRRVIRALYSHTAHQPEELSFSQGDFFHVVGNEEDKDWYEATNPVTGQRGYVPVTFFQVVDKTSSSKHSHSHSHSSHHSHSSRHQQKQRSSNQSLEDSGIDSGSYTDSASPQYSNRSPIGSHSSVHSASLPKCPPLYGVVLYDFAAERPDELESKSNDAILVIAQSNPEWYVAKPIGRLGGPGLIPVSYIEIRDMVTGKAIDVAKYLRETGTAIPRVEEWKKQTMEYKANSIPLGRIDANEAPQHQYPPQQQHPSHQIHPQHQQHQQQQHHHHQQQQQQHATARRQHQSMPQPQPQHHHPKTASHQHPDHHGGHHGPTLQDLKNKVSRDMRSQRNPSQDLRVDHPGKLSRPHTTDPYDDHPLSRTQMDHSRVINASVESFHHEEGQYWFSVRVDLSSGATRNLFRLYEDFYDFHIALLEEFPVESGRVGDQPRILPFMPIPLQTVDDKVSASRRSDLDGYVQELCRLPAKITQHPFVLELLSVKDGDMETLPGPGSSTPAPSKAEFYGEPTDRRPSTAMGTSRPHGNGATAGGGPGTGGGAFHKYKDETRSIDGSSPSTRSQATFSNPNTMSIPPLGNNNVNGSGANEMARGASGGGGGGESNGIHQASVAGNGAGSKAEDMIKVKISYEDDIMAIRIPVTITFRALQQKIFERLLCSHKELSYRDDRGDFASIQDNNDVRDAIDRSGGKLMIYVD